MTRLCSIPECGKSVEARGYCFKHYIRWWRHGDPLSGRVSRGVPLEWFKTHLNYSGDECLFWPFGQMGNGYGAVKIDGKRYMVHRYVCEHHHGPPPTPEHQAAHSCGNGKAGCIAPKHLRWATCKENIDEKTIHGTMARGETHGRCKLSESEVREIRIAKGTNKQICKRYNVHSSLISLIKRRKKWAWLT